MGSILKLAEHFCVLFSGTKDLEVTLAYVTVHLGRKELIFVEYLGAPYKYVPYALHMVTHLVLSIGLGG